MCFAFCMCEITEQPQVSVLAVCLVRDKAFLLFYSTYQASWPQGLQACSSLHILSCCRDCCDHTYTLPCLAFVWILGAQTEDLTLSLQVTYLESPPPPAPPGTFQNCLCQGAEELAPQLKSTGCSSGGPEFYSQHLHGGLQPSVTLVSSGGSDVLFQPLWALHVVYLT